MMWFWREISNIMSGPRRELARHAAFPDLRILRLDHLLPHEEHDTLRAQPLIERIRRASVWLNPPVATPIGHGDHFVVLDGANRHYALQVLGFEHILVQVVHYESPDVHLETWHHAVRGLPVRELLSPIRNIEGVVVRRTDPLSARAALAAREILAYVVINQDEAHALHQEGAHMYTQAALLREIASTYRDRSLVSRITADEIGHVLELYPDTTGIVVFPHYEPVEIMVAARDRDLLPPGITRHIIHGRALRLNYPLDMLRSNGMSLDEKNERLKLWVQERLAAKSVRFYGEATYLFDE